MQRHSQSTTALEPWSARIMRLAEVKKTTGLSRSSIYRLEMAGQFPARVKLGTGPTSATGWVEAEVQGWISDRISASRGVVA